MRLAARLLVLVLLTGCISWPTRESAFCYPKGKFNRDTKEVYAGIRCAW